MNKSLHRNSGFTVFELIASMSITGFVITIAVSQLSTYREVIREKSKSQETFSFIKSSRANASSLNTFVSVCSLEGKKCGEINSHLVAFTDHNRNQQLDENEVVLKTINTYAKTIQWRKNRSSLRFMGNGQAHGYNGTLKICYENGNGYQIVVAPTGRLKLRNTNAHC